LNKKFIYGIITLIALLSSFTAMSFLLYNDSVLWDNSSVRFQGPSNEILFCKYYPIANDLVRLGFHVFSTDFAGHGRSSGSLDGSNSSDYIAEQILLAKEKFKQLSNLDSSQIHLIGHSMGAAGILRATLIDSENVSGLVLLGGAIPTKAIDNGLVDLGPNNPTTDILIITGTWDDILTPSEAIETYNSLSNTTITDLDDMTTGSSKVYQHYTNTSGGFMRKLFVVSRLVHTYEPISPVVINEIREFCMWEDNIHIATTLISFNDFRLLFIIVEIVNIFLTAIFGIFWWGVFESSIKINQRLEDDSENVKLVSNEYLELVNFSKFLGFKPLFILGGFVLGFIPVLILNFIPVAKPYYAFIYLCPFFGYGILMMTFYSIDKMPGVQGKLRIKIQCLKEKWNWHLFLIGSTVFIVFTSLFVILLSSFLYFVFPANIRLLWLLVLFLLSFVGYYFINFESNLIEKASEKWRIKKFLNYLLFLIPFIAGAAAIGFSGTLIYFFDGIHSVLIITFIFILGELLESIWKKPLMTSLLQSFLLFFLLLPRGPLMFSFF